MATSRGTVQIMGDEQLPALIPNQFETLRGIAFGDPLSKLMAEMLERCTS